MTSRRPRGFCVLELEHTLLQQPSLDHLASRFGVEEAVRWARRERPGGIREAEQATQAFVGVPLETAQKACSGVAFCPGAAEAVAAARGAGLEVVLLARTFRPLAQHIGRRLGIEAVAGWEPEIAYGRFSGRLELPWSGHAEAVCAERVVRDLRRRHGRPAVAVSSVPDPCLFESADVPLSIGHRHGDAVEIPHLERFGSLLEGLHAVH